VRRRRKTTRTRNTQLNPINTHTMTSEVAGETPRRGNQDKKVPGKNLPRRKMGNFHSREEGQDRKTRIGSPDNKKQKKGRVKNYLRKTLKKKRRHKKNEHEQEGETKTLKR